MDQPPRTRLVSTCGPALGFRAFDGVYNCGRLRGQSGSLVNGCNRMRLQSLLLLGAGAVLFLLSQTGSTGTLRRSPSEVTFPKVQSLGPTARTAPVQQPVVKVYSGQCPMGMLPPRPPFYPVEGQVLDDVTNLPVPGAEVTLDIRCMLPAAGDEIRSNHFRMQTTSDGKGMFVFNDVPAWRVNLVASKNGYIPVWPFRLEADDPLGSYVIGAGTSVITLRIAPAASLYGTVRDEAGRPMANAWVELEHLRAWDGWPRLEYSNTVTTDGEGAYRFGQLQPGRYFLVAEPWLHSDGPPATDAEGRAIGYVPVRAPAVVHGEPDTFLDVLEGEQKRVDFQFRREVLHHVTGTVTGGGPGGPTSMIQAVEWGESGPHISKVYPSRSTGNCPCDFEAWLPAGQFRLSWNYSNPGGHFVGSVPLEVGNADISGVDFSVNHSESVEIPIEINSAAGDSTTERCLAGNFGCGFWFLQLVRLKANGFVEAGPQSAATGGTQSGGEDHKEEVSVDPGTYVVNVATTGNVYAKNITSGARDLITEPLVLASGLTPDPIRLLLAEGASVEGVTRRGGRPVRAWVYAIPRQPDERPFQPVSSGPDGKFRIQGLAPAGYFLFATDVELDLDIHDSKVLDYWRQHAQAVRLMAGRNAGVDLQVQARD